MGGGSTYTPTSRSTQEAEQVFEGSVREVELATSRPRIRNVFISFSVADEARVNFLRTQARGEIADLVFNDYSIKEPFDEAWRSQCRDRISQTSATIVMIGADTASRNAVDWEIEESYRQGKKVIGVRAYRDENHPIPRALREHGTKIINWDIAEIRKFLDED
jgi:antiphage defense system Thoeris ThsB-like protein